MLLELMRQVRDLLNAAGIVADTDPAWAATNRPCVLVTPPTLDNAARAATFELAALSAHAGGTEAALLELGDLHDAVDAVLNLDGARPAAYALTPETGAVPAYLLRLTTSY